jgi:membrane protein
VAFLQKTFANRNCSAAIIVLTGAYILYVTNLKSFSKSVYREIVEDRALGRAAELAFFLILSLFPLLICTLSLLSFIPASKELALQYLSQAMPKEAMGLIKNWVNELVDQRSSAVFSFGLLFTLWSASSGIVALMEILNVAYEVPQDSRSFLKMRIVSVILTIALALLILGGCALVIYGGSLARWALLQIKSAEAYYWIGRSASYIMGALLLFAALQLTYNYGPDVDRGANKTWPGSIFGTVAILFCSYLFSIYLRFVPSYNATYGSLGAIVVLMIWLYLVGLIFMIGAEINSELMKRHRILGAIPL